MYNLLITAVEGAWDGSPYELELERFGEHTPDELKEKYGVLNDATAKALTQFPSIFAYERTCAAPARVGYLTRVRNRQEIIRIEYRFEDSIPPISWEQLSEHAWDFDIERAEFTRTHWALKPIDLFSALAETGLAPQAISKQLSHHIPNIPLERSIKITPTVFALRDLAIEEDLVSVMMPFDASFRPVYESIRGACADVGLRCFRADDIWQESVVMQDIFNLLVRSRVVVSDFSDRNPNVMYETGIAHTLGREVVPLCQHPTDVPFDLRQHRYLRYHLNDEGLQSMQEALADRLRTLFSRR